jgi:hypothetical protein
MDKLRGTLTSVMESWPLQLVVTDAAGNDHAVGLLETAMVRGVGGLRDPGELVEGQLVEVVIRERRGGDAILTDDIVVLE